MIQLPAGVELVLASASPRRRTLLEGAGLTPEVRPAEIDETPHPDEEPLAYVARLAHAKATTVPGRNTMRPVVVVAADTTVELDGTILEKPVDRRDADRMLRLLSGRTHNCHTGVAVHGRDVEEEYTVSTAVTFTRLDDLTIDWYLGTGEADDKAGAYGIQGAAAAFVESVEGSVTNVIGLPLAETLASIRRVASAVAV